MSVLYERRCAFEWLDGMESWDDVTVEIVERGSYQSASNRPVDIAQSVRACLEATRFFAPEELERLRQEVLVRPAEGLDTVFSSEPGIPAFGVGCVGLRGLPQ